MSRCRCSPSTLSIDPLPLLVAHDLPVAGLELPAGPRVEHDQPRRAEVAAEAEARLPRLLVGLLRQLADQLAAVASHRADRLVGLVLGELSRREVAEVLVDPVGHQPADHPVRVPVGLALLVQPGLRRLPLVVDLVVVEDHRARQRREQPADVGVGPGVPVADRVLLEVLQHLHRAVLLHLAVADDLLDRAGDLVGVELVAHHHHRVGPQRGGLAQHPHRVGAEDVDPLALRVVPALEGVRGSVRSRGPAGAEEQAQRPIAGDQPDARLRELVVVGRPRLRPSRWTSYGCWTLGSRPSRQTTA